METMDFATGRKIGEANKDQEDKKMINYICNIKDPKDIPDFRSIKEFSSIWETYQYRKQNV